MARVIEDEIEQIQKRVSVERMAEARGVKLDPDAGGLRGECPFHDSGDHAIVIDPKANTWACSGCDVTSGGVIEWMMKAEGVSRRHAIELLRADHGGGGTSKVVKVSTSQKLPNVIGGSDVDDARLLEQVTAYYKSTLTTTPTAMEFLQRNGATAEAVERFRIGVSDRTLCYRIPRANRKVGADLRGRLQRLGVLRDTGHESLRGCITVPLFDEDGAVVSVYGRRLDDRAADVYVSPKGLFNIEAFGSGQTFVCSSVFDALIMWSHGIHAVTAVHEGNVDELVAALVKQGVVRVTFCFPRTDEGQKRTEQLKERLSGAETEVFRVLLPAGMNVQSFIMSSASSPSEALATVIRQAEWIGGVRPKSPVASVNEPPMTATAPTSTTTAISAPTTTATSTPTTNTADIIIALGDRRWRIRGLGNNLSYERLRVHIFVSRETKDSRTTGFFVDTIELYSARQRNAFVEQAAEELGLEPDVVKRDLGHVLLRLESLQDEQIRAALQPKTPAPTMTDTERAAAMDLLRDPKLIDRIVADFERCGVVGENENKLVGYLAATSRMLHHPLAIVVQSSSGSGKSSLMQAVLDFIPDEERRSFSALTGQSIFYMGETDIAHKVLSIAEEEGAVRASYALKVLQSEGVLTIASTAKETGTGRLVTHEYRVQGPVAIFTTTAAIDVDEELLSRCIVLAVDERPEQTRAIHERQRQAQTLDGLFARLDREAVLQLHRNAQRLLRPLAVVNPFASELVFPDHRVRARRDHRKYLGLIEAITLLHQHQRSVKTAERNGAVVEYVEVTKEDLAVADRLIASVVSRGLDDLPPMTRRVLNLLDVMVREAAMKQGVELADIRFTRREVRERLGVGSTQAWIHLRRLIDGEYIIVHPSWRGRGVVFELALEPARTTANSGVDGACSGAPSGDVRAAEEARAPEKTAPKVHRSVSARSPIGEKRSRSHHTLPPNGPR
jgi:DNA primase